MNIGVPGLSLVTGACQAPFVKAMCLDVGFLLSPDTTPSICLGKPDADSGTASSDTLIALEVSGSVGTLHDTHIRYSVSRLSHHSTQAYATQTSISSTQRTCRAGKKQGDVLV